MIAVSSRVAHRARLAAACGMSTLVLAVLVPADAGARVTAGTGDVGSRSVPGARPMPSAGPAAEDLACTGTVRTASAPGGDWRGVVVDPVRRLPNGWHPHDLVEVPDVGYDGVRAPRVRRGVVEDLRAMHRAAQRADARFVVVSAFRSQHHQREVWDRAVATEGGVDAARAGTAPPGHSEHQLGTTIDVVDPSLPELVAGLARTPAGRWLAEHAVDFGFVVSYPSGASDVTCYKPEPWHLRYVGRARAAAIDRSPLTPREFMLGLDSTAPSPPSPAPASPSPTAATDPPTAATAPAPHPTTPAPTVTAVPEAPTSVETPPHPRSMAVDRGHSLQRWTLGSRLG